MIEFITKKTIDSFIFNNNRLNLFNFFESKYFIQITSLIIYFLFISIFIIYFI